MDFTNNTSFHTLVHRTALQNDIIATSLMCKIMYDVNEEGEATISEAQDWELHQEYWVSEYGPMDKDDVYKRGGVDIMLFGSAKAPKGKTSTESKVIIEVNGTVIHQLKIFGERVWKSFLGILRISAPEPFSEIPLTLHNAFGGYYNWDGIDIPYPTNPYGKGYYHTKQDAIGKPLPNIEHHDNRVKKWNSWLEPAGTSSLPILPLKAKNNLELNPDKTKIEKLNAKFFNSAFQEMIIDHINPGDIITVKGVTTNGVYNFHTPNTELDIAISLGTKQIEKKMAIDQIGLIPDKQKAFVSYRLPFKYVIKPMEKRQMSLSISA